MIHTCFYPEPTNSSYWIGPAGIYPSDPSERWEGQTLVCRMRNQMWLPLRRRPWQVQCTRGDHFFGELDYLTRGGGDFHRVKTVGGPSSWGTTTTNAPQQFGGQRAKVHINGFGHGASPFHVAVDLRWWCVFNIPETQVQPFPVVGERTG